MDKISQNNFSLYENIINFKENRNLGKKRKYIDKNNTNNNYSPFLSSINEIKNKKESKLKNILFKEDNKNNEDKKETIINLSSSEIFEEEENKSESKLIKNILTLNDNNNNSYNENYFCDENKEKDNDDFDNRIEYLSDDNKTKYSHLISRFRNDSSFYNNKSHNLFKKKKFGNNRDINNVEMVHFQKVKLIQEKKNKNKIKFKFKKIKFKKIHNKIKEDNLFKNELCDKKVNRKIIGPYYNQNFYYNFGKKGNKEKSHVKNKYFEWNKFDHFNYIPPINENKLIICNQCHHQGHINEECLINPLDNIENYLLKCFKCGSYMHALCSFINREIPIIQKEEENDINIEDENNCYIIIDLSTSQYEGNCDENYSSKFIKDNEMIRNENFEKIIFCSYCGGKHRNEECLLKNKYKKELNKERTTKIKTEKIGNFNLYIHNNYNKTKYKEDLLNIKKEKQNKIIINLFEKNSNEEDESHYNETNENAQQTKEMNTINIIEEDDDDSYETNYHNHHKIYKIKSKTYNFNFFKDNY